MMCSRCKKRVAVVFITRQEGSETVNEGLCLKCASELGIAPVNEMMEKMGISPDEIDELTEQMEGMMSGGAEEGFEPGGASTFPPFLQNLMGGIRDLSAQNSGPPAPVPEKREEKKQRGRAQQRGAQKDKPRKFLDAYCYDLTRAAREGKLDRVVGRQREITRMIQILCRRTKNNPCLIGEPGVGKTAIAEGIAIKIAEGDVPYKLQNKELMRLDLTALVAGTQFRGQFESRIKGLIEEVRLAGNIILFIDEVHNLVGTGDAEGGMNAANILKPALSRGEIQVIGATTFNEYRKYIEKDAALERRFQPVNVEEPSLADASEMVEGIKNYYEKFHTVRVPDSIIRLAVNLSERYITDRYLPDKAIDLLDEACSHAALGCKELSEYEQAAKLIETNQAEIDELVLEDEPDYEKVAGLRSEMEAAKATLTRLSPVIDNLEVTPLDVAKVIELWTGIPAGKMLEGDKNRIRGLEESLKKQIIGQDEAVNLVVAAIRRHAAGVAARKRPASFIFVGPTGVGKTELCKVLAKEMFDSVDPLIRLDMSEYMEKYAVSKIIGSPPGYVGYDEAGQLTERVRRKPYSVILFDEIEKAHPDVLNILLQILDEGRITDSHGRTVNFENTVIIMTSNAGSRFSNTPVGFGKSEKELSRDKVMKSLEEFLRPEFIARVDEVVVFDPLSEESYGKIAALMLNELKDPLGERGITFTFDEQVPGFIGGKVYGKKYSAREIRRFIRKQIEDPIATELMNRDVVSGVHVSVKDGALSIACR